MAGSLFEVNSTQKDRDLCPVVNWKAAVQAVADGKAAPMEGVPVLDPAKVPGILYYVAVGKSPHGMDVDPSGKWIVAGGKLQPSTTVLNFEKIKAAIEKKDFEGELRGVPILKYESVVEGEVPVGLGPLHTQYDGKGNAYTSMFIDSNITKWRLPPWSEDEKKDLTKVVVDKCPVHFSVGHLVVAGSDTKDPYGKWLVAMNKLSKGRHISVGPAQPESSQLIDITGEKMKMVAEAYTEPEPHFAQIIAVKDLQPIEVYPKAENRNANAVWDPKDTGVQRSGSEVTAKVIAVRSRFVPDRIDAQVGDMLSVHVTNIEQSSDMIHGFAVNEHNMNIIIDPGETKTFRLKLTKPGVYPFYCTNFCSALHQEMQGYLVIKPAEPATGAVPADHATRASASAKQIKIAPAVPAAATPLPPPPAG
jgi:nitrous-oxide reductase